MHAKAIPPQFELVRRGRKKLILRREFARDLLGLGVESPWKWARRGDPAVRFYAGRVPAAALTLPLGEGLPVVLRRYRHGGLLGRLQRDLYFFSFTPLRELAASEYARERGIPVAEILGAVQERVGGVFHRSDLLMRHLPGGMDLGAYFGGEYAAAKWREKKEIVRAVGALVRRMHDAGLFHADLHLKNIYLAREGGEKTFYLLDLDKAHIVPSLGFAERRKNLLRFNRYLEKYFSREGIFSRSDRILFLRAYLGGKEEARAYARRHGRAFERHILRHRLLWSRKVFDRSWWSYAILRGVLETLNRLPEKTAYSLGRLIAGGIYLIDRRHRRRVHANLKLAFGGALSQSQRRRLARRHFEQVGYLAMESVRTLTMDDEELDRFYARQEVVGKEHMLEGLRRGKGVLYMISHFGNWELMSLIARDTGVPVHVLAKPIKNTWIDAWINRVRGRLGMKVMRASRLNREILERLKQNHIVVMLIDQNPGKAGEPVPFFGVPAPTTLAPAFYALKSGAAVLSAYSIRKKPGEFKIVVEPPYKLVEKKDFREAVRANTELFSRELEKYVRQYPAQWWWVHDRWKRRNIWVQMPNWVGDVVMALPFLRALRRRYPDARITAGIKEGLAPLLEGNRDVDETVALERRGGLAGLADRLRLIGRLRRGGYNMAYVLPRSWDSALVPFLAGVVGRYGYGSAGRRLILNRGHRRGRHLRRLHQADYYVNLVRHYRRIAPEDRKIGWRLPAAVERWADDYFREHFFGKKVVGIAPGATYGAAKMWPAQRYAELARRLAGRPDAAVAFFGNAAEAAWIDPLMREIPGVRLLTGKTTLPQLAALMKRCAVVVTNDSGPMHVAAAAGAPLVALFGPTDPARTGPLGPHALIRKPVACSPCKLRECPIDHRCMARISVDEVNEAVAQKL